MNLEHIKKVDPLVAEQIEKEFERQQNTIELIASENITSEAVMEACGSVLTNKYAEGKPHKRFYNGCDNVDVIEETAQKRACELFHMDHANVQPHSGAQANMAVFMAVLKPGDKVVDVSYSKEKNILIATTKGYGLWYDVEEVSPVGIKAAGVKSINLKDDTVVSGILFNANTEYLSIIMDKGTAKRLKLSEIDKSSRANRGLLLMKEIKSNPSKIIKVYALPTKNEIVVTTKNYEKELKLSEIPIMDRYSNGSYIVKDKIIDTHELTKLTSKEDLEKEVEVEPVVEKHQESLKEIDDRMMTIDDLLKNMEK